MLFQWKNNSIFVGEIKTKKQNLSTSVLTIKNKKP